MRDSAYKIAANPVDRPVSVSRKAEEKLTEKTEKF